MTTATTDHAIELSPAPLSAALTDACRLLCLHLYRHLEEAEYLATKVEDWGERDAETARELIPDLVSIIHTVLSQHGITAHGDCQLCGQPWPCPTVRIIHQELKNPDKQFATLLAASPAQV